MRTMYTGEAFKEWKENIYNNADELEKNNLEFKNKRYIIHLKNKIIEILNPTWTNICDCEDFDGNIVRFQLDYEKGIDLITNNIEYIEHIEYLEDKQEK